MSVLIPTMIGKHHLKLDMPGEFSNKVLQKCLTTTHTIHSDWDNIIRTIRENHEHAAESAPIERPMSNDKKVQRFLQTLKFKSNPIEEFWRFFCDEMQIPFDHLSVDEHKVMKDVFKRSKLLKALPNRKKGKR